MIDSRLKHAVAVGKLGSFSLAADAVGVTQSAVTKNVAGLEQQLGYPLFHRTTRGALLTEAGRDFVDRAARLLSEAAELLGEEERSADPYGGTLRIGIFPASVEWMLSDALIALLQRRPGIRFDIVTGTSERGVQLLTRGDIDVAFGMHAAFGQLKQFRCHPVGVLDAVPFARRGHPILEDRAMAVASLAKYDFVVPSYSEPYSATVHRLYEEHGMSARNRLHVVDYFPLILRIVLTTDTLGFVARDIAASERFQRDFVTLDDLQLFTGPSLSCAVRAGWPTRPGMRAFIAQVRKAFQDRSRLVSRGC